MPADEEGAKTDRPGTKTIGGGPTASDDKEPPPPSTQDTLTCVSQIFGTHEDSDSASDAMDNVWPKQKRWLCKTTKDDEPATDGVLCDEARQNSQSLNTCFNAWHCKKITEGCVKWVT